MITVDLRPPDEAAAARAARRARVLAAVVAGVGTAGLAVAHVALEVAAGATRRELVRTEDELAGLRRPVAALRRLRQRQAALAGRLAVLHRLEARRGDAVRLLDALGAAAPQGLWLSELVLAGGRLRLTGFATDDQTIAGFVARLRATLALPGLDLEEAGRDQGAALAPRRFVVAGPVGVVP